MKKILTIGIVLGLVLVGITTLVTAELIQDEPVEELLSKTIMESEGVHTENTNRYHQMFQQQMNKPAYQNTERKIKHVNFTGIWGYDDDNTTQGYVDGVLGRRGRRGFIKAEWSTIDGSSNGQVVGILKKGYFNGKILIEDQDPIKITGLYKIDREEQTLQLEWMTPQKDGWARCNILLSE